MGVVGDFLWLHGAAFPILSVSFPAVPAGNRQQQEASQQLHDALCTSLQP
jgi:hypothetical protein